MLGVRDAIALRPFPPVIRTERNILLNINSQHPLTGDTEAQPKPKAQLPGQPCSWVPCARLAHNCALWRPSGVALSEDCRGGWAVAQGQYHNHHLRPPPASAHPPDASRCSEHHLSHETKILALEPLTCLRTHEETEAWGGHRPAQDEPVLCGARIPPRASRGRPPFPSVVPRSALSALHDPLVPSKRACGFCQGQPAAWPRLTPAPRGPPGLLCTLPRAPSESPLGTRCPRLWLPGLLAAVSGTKSFLGCAPAHRELRGLGSGPSLRGSRQPGSERGVGTRLGVLC